MSRILLEVRDLWVGYGGEAVVRGVSFSVSAGQIVALVGPNGAGKTTIAKTIAGLLTPMRGEIVRHAAVGYVPQHKAVETMFPITLRQFVLTGLYPAAGLLRRLRSDDLEDMLARLGLSEHADKTLSQLSGGTLRKAMIARALISHPPLLVLDEPNAELDADSERELFTILKSLRDDGVGILFVSPQQTVALNADSVLRLHRGVVVEKSDV